MLTRPSIHVPHDTRQPTNRPTGRFVVNLRRMVRLPVFWGFVGEVSQ